MNTVLIFGYGSLLNPVSRAKTFSEVSVISDVDLHGYQRKLNAISDAFPDVAMNIAPHATMTVRGVVIELPLAELPMLQKREAGYDQVDVTNQLSVSFSQTVYTFIAPDQHPGDRKAYRTYLDTCLGGVPKELHDAWLKETVIECEIFDDTQNTLYQH